MGRKRRRKLIKNSPGHRIGRSIKSAVTGRRGSRKSRGRAAQLAQGAIDQAAVGGAQGGGDNFVGTPMGPGGALGSMAAAAGGRARTKKDFHDAAIAPGRTGRRVVGKGGGRPSPRPGSPEFNRAMYPKARPGRGRGKGGVATAMDRGRGGREVGGGYRNLAFGMGREQRGYGMGRPTQRGGRAYGMGFTPEIADPGKVAYGGQESYAAGDQAWGRGGRGGWGGQDIGLTGHSLSGRPAPQSTMSDAISQAASRGFGGGMQRRRALRNRRSRFMNQQRAGNVTAALTPVGGFASPGGGGGGSAWQGGGQAYQGKSFSKKVGTTQGAFKIGNPADNIASKKNKLAINQKS